jgi:7-cyano-7-deazaguanine reductase
MSKDSIHGPLGEAVSYPSQYDPTCLHPIPRCAGRIALGLGEVLPFHGVDIWNAYELSWLDQKGKPAVACAEFRVPADSPNIIESKSFKLYLNSLNQSRLGNAAEVQALLERDLSTAAGAGVTVSIYGPKQWTAAYSIVTPTGECLDGLDLLLPGSHPNGEVLVVDNSEIVTETLYSHLLRSRCPVTSQPDWASVEIAYTGAKIHSQSLLGYLVSFREHDEFHEHCVERIFKDISDYCQPASLTVYARYLRRGGLDINPWRSSDVQAQALNIRGVRQ